jgi:hypothetical protein
MLVSQETDEGEQRSNSAEPGCGNARQHQGCADPEIPAERAYGHFFDC